jgi:heterotetrameric sarcosine oxidase gamma subunit
MTADRHNDFLRGAPAGVLQQAGVNTGGLQTPLLELREMVNMALLRLHSLQDSADLAESLAAANVNLPLHANEASGQDPATLCLRPGEWLLASEQAAPDELLDRLRPHVDPSLTVLLDNSDGLGVFRLSGPAAPWLLGKLSGLDFLSGVSEAQHAARTRMADIAVVLHCRPAPDGSPVFDLLFDRSVARYLWGLLVDAAPHAEELFTTHGAVA